MIVPEGCNLIETVTLRFVGISIHDFVRMLKFELLVSVNSAVVYRRRLVDLNVSSGAGQWDSSVCLVAPIAVSVEPGDRVGADLSGPGSTFVTETGFGVECGISLVGYRDVALGGGGSFSFVAKPGEC